MSELLTAEYLATEYLQVHALVHFPASNPNRNREGEPKTIMIGNVDRGLITSQCLKRTWRVSDVFAREFGALGEKNLGLRTKELGGTIYDKLIKDGLTASKAEQWTLVLAAVFGVTKPEKDDTMDHLKNETLFFASPEELAALDAYVQKIIAEKLPPPNVKGKEAMEKEASKIRPHILRRESTAVDLSMFGRMFAQDKSFSVDGSVQVAHAFTVHGMDIQNDFYVGVDDIKQAGEADENRGGGHAGDASLGAGVFYLYASINLTTLRKQLKDKDLRGRACSALIEALCTVFPKAKGNSCAQQSRIFFARAEYGDKAPRNLSLAYLDPIERRGDMGRTSIQKLIDASASIDKIYGQCWKEMAQFNFFTAEGSLQALLDLARKVA
jgi:CRISPR system Cascade subunit CasC